jgi:multidrug efflux pump subunit AcrB
MTPFRLALVFGFLGLLGLFCIPYLSIDYIPQAEEQSLTVTYSYHGRPPLVVEQEATALIENHLSTLEGIRAIRSVSSHGNGYVELTFLPGTDMAHKEMELYATLRQLRASLPRDIPFPAVMRRANDSREKPPLLIYEFTYTGDDTEANLWLENILLPRLGSLPALERVSTSGNRQFAWKVTFDQNRLDRLALVPEDLARRIGEQLGRKEIALVTQGTCCPSA